MIEFLVSLYQSRHMFSFGTCVHSFHCLYCWGLGISFSNLFRTPLQVLICLLLARNFAVVSSLPTRFSIVKQSNLADRQVATLCLLWRYIQIILQFITCVPLFFAPSSIISHCTLSLSCRLHSRYCMYYKLARVSIFRFDFLQR